MTGTNTQGNLKSQISNLKLQSSWLPSTQRNLKSQISNLKLQSSRLPHTHTPTRPHTSISAFRILHSAIALLLLPSFVFAGDAAPALPTLHKKVIELGFNALQKPLRLYDGQPPALSKKGVPEVPELRLKYVPDEEKIVPAEITVELSASEYPIALSLFPLDGSSPPPTLAAGQTCRLIFASISPIRLADLQFSNPIGGDRKSLQEYQLPIASLIAKKVSIQLSSAGQDPVVYLAKNGVALAAEYRKMKLKMTKKKVLLDMAHPVVHLGKKPKDPRYKRVALSFPRPESGEDPSTVVASVARLRFPCEIVQGREPATVKERRNPSDWVFRGRQQKETVDELILPSQFDGKEALGVFLRVTSHKKEAFHPRTREIKLEAILVFLEL